MERHSVFLDRKNQYCENAYTTKYNLQIQCNPYQITNGIFHRTRTKNFTIHVETQKTPNSQSSLEKEEWSLRNQRSWLQTILQNYSAAKSLQSCPTLCDPRDGSPPGSSVPGILQARTLEWVASAFSNAWKWKVKVKSLSHVRPLATPWTAAHQAPPSMGFSRQEYWSGVPLPYCLESNDSFTTFQLCHLVQVTKLQFALSIKWE